ncbi:O-methyltransferase [Membranihabitans marinus]|uniref:O-methyltransferase n=1 Tax=Membranihabitans marinus TaxID=1227546 RepID=UPI001F2DD66E|nr:class I SAM-dependent methyltransferase [Membranihabitans marinus]
MWYAFCKYYFKAHTIYQVHSPLLYDFCQHVLEDNKGINHPHLEVLKSKLKSDQRIIERKDYGSGSKNIATTTSVAKVAQYALSHPIVVNWLSRMMTHYQPSVFLELGTSLGLTTSYLATAHPPCRIITVEGDPAIYNIATENFNQLQLSIDSHLASFEEFLNRDHLDDSPPNMIFIDGHHNGSATLKYFEKLKTKMAADAIIIFDDIHWTPDMEDAWEIIKKDECVSYSVDLFQIGIIFTQALNKEAEHRIIIPWKYKPWKLKLK